MDEKKKKLINETIEKDSFWIKVLVITIIVIWTSLVAGNWAGYYIADTKILSKHSSLNTKNSPAEKPKHWKTVVDLDNEQKIGQNNEQSESNEYLDVPDFRNIDNPIPGIDDQSIRSFGVQERTAPDEKVTGTPPSLPEKLTVQEKDNEYIKKGEDNSKPDKEEINKNNDRQENPLITNITDESTINKVSQNKNNESFLRLNNETEKKTENELGKKTENTKKQSETDKIGSSKNDEPQKNTGSYNLQVGSFSKEENAQMRVQDLQKKGYSARIEKVKDGEKEYYKVKITDMGNRENAASNVEKLKADGIEAIIISH